MKREIITCDLCGRDKDVSTNKMEVIFETEQTEGRSSKPYIDTSTFDICSNCLGHVLKGNYIFASGAMGYNKYYFKTKEATNG